MPQSCPYAAGVTVDEFGAHGPWYIRGVVQIWKKGGENNLHYHAGTDSLWIVLNGKARFYGPDDGLRRHVAG
ncbi:MAG: hypothetical protein O7F75_08410 [Alphaproteobacteria bacterium]|nr:hypothetical protein [Alphaproteobacteria bacterium]